MADKRAPHRRGTTSRRYRKAQAHLFATSSHCARCGGPMIRIRCSHPTHAELPYCPTYRYAPSYGHKQDLQHGGSLLDPRNRQLEHFGCNSKAGAQSKARAPRPNHQSWSF